jgi:hypothetical protein
MRRSFNRENSFVGVSLATQSGAWAQPAVSIKEKCDLSYTAEVAFRTLNILNFLVKSSNPCPFVTIITLLTFLKSLKRRSISAIHFRSGILDPRMSKMMFSDCVSAERKLCSRVYLQLLRGLFISHSKSSMRISGVRAPFLWTGGSNSTSKPYSVRKTTVAFSCV